jgi:hypothetical protein
MRYRVLFELDSPLTRRDMSNMLLEGFLPDRRDVFVPSACGELVYLAVEEVKNQMLFEHRTLFGSRIR